MCGIVDSSDEESTVSNIVPNEPTPYNKNEVCSEDVLDVSKNNDIFFTDVSRFGEIEQSHPVQNVHDESKKSENMTFIYSASEKDSDEIEDKNSLMYMTRDVQNVDLLNFDDSDVSIGEEEEDLFL